MLLRGSAIVAGGARSATTPVVENLPPTAINGLGSVVAPLSPVPHSRVRLTVAVLATTTAVAAATEIDATGPFADDAVVVAADAALAERGSPLPRPGLDAAWLY